MIENAAPGTFRAMPEGATRDLWRDLAEAGDALAYCQAWLGLLCQDVEGVRSALLLLDDGSGTFVPAAFWPNRQTDMTHLGAIARRCLNECAGQLERSPERGGALFVAYPIQQADKLLGTVILEATSRGEPQVQALQRRLHWGAGRLEVLLQARRLEDKDHALERARLALDLAVSVGEQARLDEAAMQLANELATRLGCQRVAIGLEVGGRLRLQAMSGAAWFEKKSDFVVALENAMEEALDQGRTVCHPPIGPQAGILAVAHRDLVSEGAVCTVPLIVRGSSIGAITCLSDAVRDADFLAALEGIAALVAPDLALRRDLNRWLAGRLADKAHWLWLGLLDPRRPSFRVGALALAALVLFFSLYDSEYRVSGRAVVEGQVQRAVVAPFDGFVASAAIRAGQRVKRGDSLATLDERDLLLEERKWQAESEQAERKYRDALAKHERANARILSAQLNEASAQLDLARDKLSRARLVAPFDGIVVSGDLSQMLGSPVEKGKVLFEVAPLDAYRVVIKLPEGDIRDVRTGQSGRIVLAGLSDQSVFFRVKNIGVATAEEGENLFRIEAELQSPPPGIRPGMEGVGKVVVGERRLIWIWTHALFDWLSLKLWHWLP